VEEPSSSKVEAILRRTEVSPTPKLTKNGKPDGRGRPKKQKKPTYSKGKYTENPMSIATNSFIATLMNKTVLKNATEKMEGTELEIGEASIYVMDYYSAGILGHPIMVLVSAFLGMGMLTYSKIQTIPTIKEETKTLEERGGKI